MEEVGNRRHVCCNIKDREEMISRLNEYVCRIRQRDAMSSRGKYYEVPEFMKTKQPRYEEEKDIAPLITSVPVMEFRLTYDKNKIKENNDHPNMSYILIEEPEEKEKVPVTCYCCKMNCYLPYTQYKQSSSSNLCFPCYYYCYPSNQYMSTPQRTCLYKQFHQCQPVRLQSIPQYCVPNWSQQPCIHWGEGNATGNNMQETNVTTSQNDGNCNTPVCKDNVQDENCNESDRPVRKMPVCMDLQPSDGRRFRNGTKGCVMLDISSVTRQDINTDTECKETIQTIDEGCTTFPDDLQPNPSSNDAYVYNASVSVDKPVEELTAPQNPPADEKKSEPERPIKPYKRYKLKAPYMYDMSDSEL